MEFLTESLNRFPVFIFFKLFLEKFYQALQIYPFQENFGPGRLDVDSLQHSSLSWNNHFQKTLPTYELGTFW